MTQDSKNQMQTLGNPLRDAKKIFDEMIIPFRPVLWRYCYNITGSPWDAEDLVQETLIKAFSSLAQLWQPINPKWYLFKIASNTWIDQCRRRKLKIDPMDTIEERFYKEDPDFIEIEEAIEKIVLHLPPRQRVVFLLIDVFQFKANEVGEIIGTSEGAVKALLNRARGKIKQFNDGNKELENQSIINNEDKKIVDLFIKAFNRRDPDGIASLLDDNINNDIVHCAQEYGKEIVKKYSLSDWSKDPVMMKAELHHLWGRPTIVQLGKMNDFYAVYNLNLIEIENGKIIKMKDFYFCPELLMEAAKNLNLNVFPRKYTL
ncbi:RNA polymerase sigma factor [Bacillaceae bacterium Marseille-Q3522]|nr:RNA polymerase sigma factor [Bacillaceae bacterium Marseille-Q3522]